jgi:hypothetical protein
MKKNLLLFFAISCVANALAAHIEFDTPEAHVVIVRPSDLWSGDTSSMEKNLDAIKEKKFSFTYKVDGIIQNGNPMIFGSISNHPVVQGVVKRIEKNGWKLGYSENRHSLWIDQAVPIKPSDIKDFMAVQNEYFKHFVISQGDPATLESRTSNKKILGSIMAVGALAVLANKFGIEGGLHVDFGSGMTDSIYRLSFEYKAVLTPTLIENLDLSNYDSIDARRVKTKFPDRLGEIIIAYKQPKTVELENKLMIEAIAVLAGVTADTTEIEKNRLEDFEKRKAIWNECVNDAAPECKSK